VTLILVLAGLCASDARAQESIEGVWRVSRIDRDVDNTSNSDPDPGLVIFTGQHYSIVWTPESNSTNSFAQRWVPTDEEKLKRYGEIVVNTGRYEIDGDQIRVRPIVSRVPEFIGGLMIYEYEWSGENLILTLLDEYSFDGVRAPWAETASGQVHLELSRLEY